MLAPYTYGQNAIAPEAIQKDADPRKRHPKDFSYGVIMWDVNLGEYVVHGNARRRDMGATGRDLYLYRPYSSNRRVDWLYGEPRPGEEFVSLEMGPNDEEFTPLGSLFKTIGRPTVWAKHSIRRGDVRPTDGAKYELVVYVRPVGSSESGEPRPVLHPDPRYHSRALGTGVLSAYAVPEPRPVIKSGP